MITSRHNADYKRWLQVAQGRPGKIRDWALLEGEHLCSAWLAHRGMPECLIAGESARALPWVARLWHQCGSVARVLLSDALARALSAVEHGPPVFFLVAVPQPRLPAAIMHACLWLDRVQDPGNLGTLLRTAAAAGLQTAFLSAGCAFAWAPKVLRSGQGAHAQLRIHEQVDLVRLSVRLRIPLVATSLMSGSRSLYDLDLRPDVAWLFGNEGQGIAPDLLEKATWRVHIPQSDQVESLNVAAAAAICLFEQRRQQAGQPRPVSQ